MKRLPQADLILALDENGTISEQGTFEELNLPGKYIYSLQVISEERRHLSDNAESEELGEVAKAKATTKAAESLARKTGDWATYKYYTRALGRWPLLVFVILVTINETFVGLNSKTDLELDWRNQC